MVRRARGPSGSSVQSREDIGGARRIEPGAKDREVGRKVRVSERTGSAGERKVAVLAAEKIDTGCIIRGGAEEDPGGLRMTANGDPRER